MVPASTHDDPRERLLGLGFGLAAYGAWGFIPIYFKAVGAAPPLEVLCHRVVWGQVLLLLLCWRTGRLPAVREALRPGRVLASLALTTLLIAINWLTYIWAVVNGRVLEGSLGYYINPLVNVLLGVVILGERLGRAERAAVALAAAGVGFLTLRLGHPPVIALTLACSFGLYGLLRKRVGVGPLVGLTVETGLLLPLSLGYIAWSAQQGTAVFRSGSLSLDLLLMAAGPITALPLLAFTAAARRLTLTTLGFLQYLAPTLQFLLAIGLYGEPFSSAQAVAFVCIWTALALVTAASLRRHSRG